MTTPTTPLDTYTDTDHLTVVELAKALNRPQGQIWGDAISRKRLPKPTVVDGKLGWNVGAVRAALKENTK